MIMKTGINNIIGGQRSNVIYLLEQGTVSGVNFLMAILLARFIGVEHYGLFVINWLIIMFFSSLQQALIIAPLQSYLPALNGKSFKSVRSLINWMQLAFILISVILLIAFGLVSEFLTPQWGIWQFIPVLIPLMLAFLIYDFLRKDLFRQFKAQRALVMGLVLAIVQISGFGLLIYFSALTVNNWLIVLLISHFAAILIELPKHIRTYSSARFNMLQFTEVWKFARWLAGTSILQWFSGNFFILAAGSIIGPVAVGAIRIIQNLFGLLSLLLQAIENKVPVSASKIYGMEGFKPMLKFIAHVMKFIAPVYILFLGLIVVFNNEIIELVYGSQYVEYAWLIYPFCILFLLILTGIPLRFVLRTIKQTQHIFIAYVMTTAFGVLSANFIVSQMGILGVVIGMAFSQLISVLWFGFAIKKYHRRISNEPVKLL